MTITTSNTAAEETTPAELLRECRASGQISDAQWHQHCEGRPDLLDTSPPVRAEVVAAPQSAAKRLTKADTVALWRAVDAFSSLVSAMYELANFTPEQIASERAKLVQAKRALRKVNAIRKQAAPLRGSKAKILPTGSKACAG